VKKDTNPPSWGVEKEELLIPFRGGGGGRFTEFGGFVVRLRNAVGGGARSGFLGQRELFGTLKGRRRRGSFFGRKGKGTFRLQSRKKKDPSVLGRVASRAALSFSIGGRKKEGVAFHYPSKWERKITPLPVFTIIESTTLLPETKPFRL